MSGVTSEDGGGETDPTQHEHESTTVDGSAVEPSAAGGTGGNAGSGLEVARQADDEVTANTPSDEAIALAKAELEALLGAADIGHIVFVDNEFEVDVADVLTALRRLSPERRSHVSFLGDHVDFDIDEEDEAVWIAAVESRWEQLSERERVICGSDALARSGIEDLRHQPNAGAVGPLLPAGFTELLSPAQWRARSTAVLGEANGTGTLLLLDRHFEDEDNEGIVLLKEYFDAEGSRSMRAGVLTNTVTRDGEVALWRELQATYDLPGDRFVVISKENLSGNTLSFPQALKVALLTTHFDALRQAVADALREAHEAAMSKLGEISPYSFEQLVFASSRSEGVWEPDTLRRVASIYIRDLVLTSLRGSDDVHAEVRGARQIASVTTREESATTEAARALAGQLQHAEVFESGEYVNAVHLPLELGDVFGKIGGTTRFVLVMQPCDLMVRESGKRAPDLEFMTLAKVVEQRPAAEPDDYYTIEFLGSEGMPGYVLLNRSWLVPVEALDLCVYNKDGASQIRTDGDVPNRLTPHWDKRFERHQDWAKAAVQNVLSGESPASKEFIRQAVLYCNERSLAKGSITDNNKLVRYNLKRVGRILSPVSLGLLNAFLAYQGRMAFEGRLAGGGAR